MKMNRRFLLTSVAALAASPAFAAERAVYRDPKAPVALRVTDLLGRMTLEEKAAQLCGLWFNKGQIIDIKTGVFSPEKAAAAIPNGLGHLGRPSDTAGMPYNVYMDNAFREPDDTIAFTNAFQRFLVEKTRLGIPALLHEETAHGLAVKGATSFPIPTALGSTWDTDLVEQVFTYVARQTRARGVAIGFSPVLDLIRDPRWGRSEEFFGEDPYLVGEMGLAAIWGLQGRARPIAKDRIFATAKHFVHGAPQNGLNIGPADMSERVLREYYLPPFAKAVRKGDVALIMASYNEVGGIPSHANRHLLQDDGRQLLGFKGTYISDYGAVEELATLHHMAADKAGAAVLAMNAGVDVNLPEGSCYALLPDLVKSGRVKEEAVDAAVARVLALKFEAGLFEHPYVESAVAAGVFADGAGPKLARHAAQKAIVLLKNDGILPLDSGKPLKLAVIGPDSVDPHLGGYSGVPAKAVGILEGLKAQSGSITISQADGVWITQPDAKGRRLATAPIHPVPPADNDARIQEAVALATNSDVVLLVVGDNEQITREATSPMGPGDRDSLSLFGDQDRLVDALVQTGKPIIAILQNGRPLAVNTLASKANALIEGWYLGEQGGHAVADVVFGQVNPGGKLPVTFPHSVGELPAFYDRHPSSDKVPYVEGKRVPLFPFGHGLSYTTFTISAPRLSKAAIGAADTFSVEVDVANTGRRDGDEVVQIYIRDMVSSAPRPILELKAFRRVTLKTGETKTVRVDLGPDDLTFWSLDMQWVVEPGQFQISAGNSSTSLQHTMLTVS